MSQSITDIAQLRDIPLPPEQPAGDSLSSLEKTVSKTNSLRRFFKISQRKSCDMMVTGEKEIPKTSKKNADPEAARNDPIMPEKRFKLRVGSGALRVESALSEAAPSGSSTSTTTSKTTLKASISNYWNTIFNRHSLKDDKATKAAAAAEEGHDTDEDDDDEDLNEAIHNLTMSDEAKNKVADAAAAKPESPKGAQ